MDNKEDTPMVAVPVEDLLAVENSRKAIYRYIEENGSITNGMDLIDITQAFWKVGNKKYKPCVPKVYEISE